MAASSKSAFLVSIVLGAAWVQAGGCSSGTSGGAMGNRAYDGGLPPIQLDGPLADQSAGGIQGLDPLCGMAACLPDSPASVPGDGGSSPPRGGSSGEGGAGTSGGEGGAGLGGAAGDDGAGGAGSGMGGLAGDGGEGGSAEAAGGGGVGGEGGSPSGETGGADAGSNGATSGAAGSTETPPTPVEGCRVMRDGNRVVSDYAPAGAQDVNGPCFSSADCKPGLGCVNEENIGRCLPFCCKGNDSCLQAGTYCAPRPLREMPINSGADDPSDGLLVPVCVAAVACSLEQPYPCPAGMDCTCGDKACLVVRSGLTSCEEPPAGPGGGMAGQPCPCAWGHVCSRTTDRCVELCSTASDAKACSEGKCQDTAELPVGWGVCVAVAASR